jgi:hypothetical protein
VDEFLIPGPDFPDIMKKKKMMMMVTMIILMIMIMIMIMTMMMMMLTLINIFLLHRYGEDTEWLIHFDVDEFLIPGPDFPDIPSVLRQYDDTDFDVRHTGIKVLAHRFDGGHMSIGHRYRIGDIPSVLRQYDDTDCDVRHTGIKVLAHRF